MQPMTPKAAWLYAASWGSFLTNGDPGACMYGFDEQFLVQSEEHRANCLAWTEGCRRDVTAKPDEFEGDELDKLSALEAALRAAPPLGLLEEREASLDEFTKAYITAALWSTTDNADECGGSPLDENYGLAHIDAETFAGMVEDCRAFQASHGETMARCGGSPDQGGHDFWLTRNGHGAGFWDRGDAVWDKAARDELTASSKAYGGQDLYVGDDGKIYG